MMRENGGPFSDWLLHEGRLFTFRDINFSTEQLSKVVDKGTIDSVKSIDFYNTKRRHYQSI